MRVRIRAFKRFKAKKFKRVRISELTEKLGITKSRVARKLKVTYMTVNRWDSGESKPSVSNIDSLLEVLECEPFELLEFGIV